jgi:hypothetical protein
LQLTESKLQSQEKLGTINSPYLPSPDEVAAPRPG